MASRQICIIGGTFNPIHMGHLQMARSAQAQCMADEVWFMPAGQPWQKPNAELAPADVRQKLVELAIEGVHSWRVEPFEIEHVGPTYTVDTLERLSEQYPDYKFSFVIGADQLANLTSWKHWQSLFDYARIGVVDRTQWGDFSGARGFKTTFAPRSPVSHTHAQREHQLNPNSKAIRAAGLSHCRGLRNRPLQT